MKALRVHQSDWPTFLAQFDPEGQLTPRQAAVIRQLYQVLRQSGYEPICKAPQTGSMWRKIKRPF